MGDQKGSRSGRVEDQGRRGHVPGEDAAVVEGVAQGDLPAQQRMRVPRQTESSRVAVEQARRSALKRSASKLIGPGSFSPATLVVP